MALVDEIRENLAARLSGAMQLNGLDDRYPAWSFWEGTQYGVAVLTDSDETILERFASCVLRSQTMDINHSGNKRYLVLACTDETLRYTFASVCADFVDPGERGERRETLLRDPFDWWTSWCELLGNMMINTSPYSVIGELMVLDAIMRDKPGEEVVWEAAHGGTHDIESPDAGYEVKSTVQKYKTVVEISSQNQLSDDNKLLYLYFVRLERSVHGVSINDLVENLVSDGYDRIKLEKQLAHLGFEKGTQRRADRYKCLERRKYVIDDTFPKITGSSFPDGKMPKNIVKINYTVDLDGIGYTEW